MWTKPPNRRSRTSSSIMTAVCWYLTLVAAKPRSSVVQVPAPDTRNLTDKLVRCFPESWSVVSCCVEKNNTTSQDFTFWSKICIFFHYFFTGFNTNEIKGETDSMQRNKLRKFFTLDTFWFSRIPTGKVEVIYWDHILGLRELSVEALW
jgi:hypothetical protein